ncbi:cbb3-type cytochrome oxidase assembly protein CcoS [Thauera linaloolentis]|uniref:Cytochrome oxidase maturation protein, cbb3-type n=1 Tax=Thauera linaloolentis (strain DSM 12138 / JCM 21573 / CCUG 41526 / CIP 105981 / IAM 15112 / NBRC 102519 / 47Lol) TaxID=1123367 RepID=N6Y5I8_THAL4|nr:cbb3-type cytochrome oxidase assembly protein CcoS [Thauera linaloolentis]ENO89451.1 cytochrome oxidase maturation protein, cbb3-type [Thauera linaloolentis 47Lol = DSM 12138]MCM8566912.1 cbb3-type cytochrome oxidase assembly protein CcoS [Thauera linaloolentis]
MESLYLLIPLSVVLVFIIGALFWWSLRNGQYDDMEGPAYRLLLDDRDELPADVEARRRREDGEQDEAEAQGPDGRSG